MSVRSEKKLTLYAIGIAGLALGLMGYFLRLRYVIVDIAIGCCLVAFSLLKLRAMARKKNRDI